MKKLVLIFTLLIGFTSSIFAEHVISWNVTPLNVGIYNFDKANANYKFGDFRILFGGEYDYLFPSNLYIGGMVNLGCDAYILSCNAWDDTSLSGTGFDFLFAPAVGYKFGKRHFIAIQLMPLYFNYSSFSGDATAERKYNGRTITASVKFSCKGFETGSGLRMNFQWGNNLLRNGFFVGLYVPWNYKISDIDTELLKSDDFSFTPKTVRFEIGYKMSFVF